MSKITKTEAFYIVNAGKPNEAVLPVPFELDNVPTEQFEELLVTDRRVVLSVAANSGRDAENPLTDWEGNGEIHWHPRARYSIKGFDSYLEHAKRTTHGDAIVDDEKLNRMWHDKVMAVPLELFIPLVDGGDEDDAEQARIDLADWAAHGGDGFETAVQYQLNLDYSERQRLKDALDALEDAIDWQYELAVEQATEAPEPWVVPLDCFEHGLMRLDVAGTGPNCYWDTSRNAALWVPDRAAFPELYRRAAVYAYGSIDDSLTLKTGEKYNAQLGHGKAAQGLGIFKTWAEAYEALEKAAGVLPIVTVQNAVVSTDPALCRPYILRVGEREFNDWEKASAYRLSLIPFEDLQRGYRIAAEEMAQAACTLYTAYCNGDVWEHYTLEYTLADGAAPGNPESWELAGSWEDWSSHYGIEDLEAERAALAKHYATAVDTKSETGHEQALALGAALAKHKEQ